MNYIIADVHFSLFIRFLQLLIHKTTVIQSLNKYLLQVNAQAMNQKSRMPIVRGNNELQQKQAFLFKRNQLALPMNNNNNNMFQAPAEARAPTAPNNNYFSQKAPSLNTNNKKPNAPRIRASATTQKAGHVLTSATMEEMLNLEPRAIWEGPGTPKANKNMNHPAKEGTDPLTFRSHQQIMEALLQRNQGLLKNAKDVDLKNFPSIDLPTKNPPPLQKEHMNSDYFLDGRELERNVVVDYATDRSYVYTTDLATRWTLPEFLYLDLPNSTYVARACGQFVTNKLILDLKQMAMGPPRTSMENVLKCCNRSIYEVSDLFVPSELIYGQHQQPRPTTTDTPVQAIVARFRLRYAREGTNIHKMLCHNFMNSQPCPHGIIVFLPCMQEGSMADRFWGKLGGVDALPRVEEDISNAKLDKWCVQVAKQHGTFRGNVPEAMGRAIVTENYGPFPRATNVAVAQAMPKATKKVGPARKRTSAKSLRKTKTMLSKIQTMRTGGKIVRHTAVAVKTEMR